VPTRETDGRRVRLRALENRSPAPEPGASPRGRVDTRCHFGRRHPLATEGSSRDEIGPGRSRRSRLPSHPFPSDARFLFLHADEACGHSCQGGQCLDGACQPWRAAKEGLNLARSSHASARSRRGSKRPAYAYPTTTICPSDWLRRRPVDQSSSLQELRNSTDTPRCIP
jgi:hypothetical protein